MLNIVLVEPEIPQNSGNIARTCAATGSRLHLIKPLGFDISDKAVQAGRAGLLAPWWTCGCIENLEDFFAEDRRAGHLAGHHQGAPGLHQAPCSGTSCYLIFGKETAGLPGGLPQLAHRDRCIRIPIRAEARCLNLSNSVAILAYEALRQLDFPGLSGVGADDCRPEFGESPASR